MYSKLDVLLKGPAKRDRIGLESNYVHGGTGSGFVGTEVSKDDLVLLDSMMMLMVQ